MIGFANGLEECMRNVNHNYKILTLPTEWMLLLLTKKEDRDSDQEFVGLLVQDTWDLSTTKKCYNRCFSIQRFFHIYGAVDLSMSNFWPLINWELKWVCSYTFSVWPLRQSITLQSQYHSYISNETSLHTPFLDIYCTT